MRPGHIRVFDGLRITTEHVNHLQGAMHSALQEIREIFGLGRVYFGFEVVPAGEQALTVQPGLAFDYQGNRLVFDEPRTLPVSFGLDEATKFVCLKYDQVEAGQVEGQFTLIWDSCSVVLRATMPEVKENLIPISKITKSGGGEGKAFEIISLFSKERAEKAAEPSHTEEIKEAPEGTATSEKSAAPAEGGDETTASSGINTGSTEEPSIEKKEAEAKILPEPDAPVSWPRPWRVRVQQGISRLTADAEAGHYLNAAILEPLKRKLNGRGVLSDEGLLLKLAEKEVTVGFPLLSLNCHTIISAAMQMIRKPAAEEAQPQPTELKYQSTSQGEVTFVEDLISQFGLSTIQSYAGTRAESVPWPVSELTERGIAYLPFSALWNGKENENARVIQDILQPLQLLIRLEPSDFGFRMICNLLWKGTISKEIIQTIETQNIGFTWEILLGWNALGESSE